MRLFQWKDSFDPVDLFFAQIENWYYENNYTCNTIIPYSVSRSHMIMYRHQFDEELIWFKCVSTNGNCMFSLNANVFRDTDSKWKAIRRLRFRIFLLLGTTIGNANRILDSIDRESIANDREFLKCVPMNAKHTVSSKSGLAETLLEILSDAVAAGWRVR